MTETKDESALKAMKEAIRALNPGFPLTLAAGLEVTIATVRVRDIEAFTEEISRVLPRIMMVLGDDTHKEPVEILGQLVPICSTQLVGLIDSCVSPQGIFRELPHHLAAPVIQAWVQENLLDEGKVEAWKKGFQPLSDQFQALTKGQAQV